jgi:hypothetical protein
MLSKSEIKIMKKSVFSMLFAVILCMAIIGSVYATTITVESSITRDFYAVFTFSDINAPTYQNIKNNALMTGDTLPVQLWDNMAQKGLLGVEFYSQSINFNDNTHSIVSAFNLRGPSIINSTIDRTVKIETFRMDTKWRKFYLNITTDFHFNFTRDLATPLSYWMNSTGGGVTSYSYSNSTAGVSFSFQLPSYARNTVVVGDTIIFDAPYEPSFEDKLINSPILILIALAVVGAVIYFYRKIR